MVELRVRSELGLTSQCYERGRDQDAFLFNALRLFKVNRTTDGDESIEPAMERAVDDLINKLGAVVPQNQKWANEHLVAVEV